MRHLALVLATLLVGNLFGQSSPNIDVEEKVRAFAIGTKLTVKTQSGEVIRGKLLSAERETFTLQVGRRKATVRTVASRDVATIAADRPSHTPVAAWVAVGAITAVVVIVIAVFAIERHNEGG